MQKKLQELVSVNPSLAHSFQSRSKRLLAIVTSRSGTVRVALSAELKQPNCQLLTAPRARISVDTFFRPTQSNFNRSRQQAHSAAAVITEPRQVVTQTSFSRPGRGVKDFTPDPVTKQASDYTIKDLRLLGSTDNRLFTIIYSE